MEIVGYNNDQEFTGHLTEATVTCTYDELKEIASFLDGIIKDYDADNGQCCRHLRDNVKEWDKASSDLIVLIP